MKHKIFSLLIISILILPFAKAEVYVNYNFREGIISETGQLTHTTTPLTNVGVLGFVCLDSTCSTVGNKIFDYSTGSNDYIQLVYSTQQQSQYGYGLYFYKQDYIGWEQKTGNVSGTGTVPGIYTYYLSKRENCQSSINSLSVTGNTIIGNPITIQAEIQSPLSDSGSGLDYLPLELQSYYQSSVNAYLEIYDNADNLIYTSPIQQLSINSSSIANAEFTWTPTNYGNYRVVIKTNVPDNKCSSSVENIEEQTFTVSNQPAQWNALNDQIISEDSADNTIVYPDLLLQCTDPDDITNMQVTSVHDHYYLFFSENDLIINNLEQNYNGIETVNLDCNGIPNSFVLTVNPVNDAPIANDDSYGVNEDEVLNVPLPGVLVNDNDIENDPLTAYLISDVANGILNLNIDGSFVYTPNSDFNGIDSFTYTANDGYSDSNTATVTILVNPVNDAPIANNIISNTNENTEIILTLDYSDIDINDKAESCSILSITDGTISQPCTCNNGICTVGLTPLPNSVANILANYIVNDGELDSNIATITITVNSINNPAVWQTLSNKEIDENSPADTIVYPDLLLQCTDPDDPINMQVTSVHDHYYLFFSENDLIINNLEQNYNGIETVNLDCNGIPNSFVLTVNPVNDAPTIKTIAITTALINQLYTYDVDASDPENDPLTYSLTNAPSGMTIDPNTGLIQWTPTTVGVYNVAIRVEDNHTNFDTQVYNIQVSSIPTKQYAKKHLFSIGSISFPTNTYHNGDIITGFIQLKNIGQLKEKNIQVSVSIPDLDVETIAAQNVGLGSHDIKWIPFELELPYNANQNEYLIKVDIKNSNYKESRYIPIYIEEKYKFNF